MQKRQIFYYGSILFIVISANTGHLETLLNASIGVAWSSPVVKFVIENSQGFLVILMLSIYFDYVRGGLSYSIKLNDKVDNIYKLLEQNLMNFNFEFIKKADKKKLLNNLLSYEYHKAENISNLTSTIFSDKPYYLNVNINYTLRNMKKENLYRLRYNLQFEASIDTFVIAFVCSADLQDKLSASSDLLNDIFTFSDKKSMEDNLNLTISNKSTLQIIEELSNGTNQYIDCPFSIIPQNEYAKYINQSLLSQSNEIFLLMAKTGNRTKKKFILTHDFIMNKSDHYCYWTADRPMFVEKIVFDASQFSYCEKTSYVFHPFMSNSTGFNTSIKDENIFSINIYNWLVKGQGVILVWG